jgi:hypothetical protein
MKKRYKAIEAHPTSTRKALQRPIKKVEGNTRKPKTLGLKGELETCPLAAHRIDATAAASTAVLPEKSS